MKRKHSASTVTRLLAIFVATLAVVPGTSAATKFRVLHSFDCAPDGCSPNGTLTLDKKGSLYGAAFGGGAAGQGLIFELTPQTNGKWREKVLYQFLDGQDGALPNGGLVFDASGNLYGTTEGDSHPGTVFELSPGSGGWSLTSLHMPGSREGVVMDKVGNLYGYIGEGAYGDGAVAELSPGSDGWTLSTLYSFCRRYLCPDGEGPRAPLSRDAGGNLFGTTLYGGNNTPQCPGSLGCGVAFKMTPNSNGTWKYRVLHRFAAFPNDGQYPLAGMVVDASGDVYGATYLGGPHGSGTIFKFTPVSGGHWKQTVLYDFPNCADGCGPDTTLIFDKKGKLYGTGGGGKTACGGYYCGVVFKLTPQASGKWKYSALHRFNSQDGAGPNGVIVDGKGNVFGTTLAGGAHNVGVAFEITP